MPNLLSKKIKEVRDSKYLTQTQLESLMPRSYAYVSSIETGKKNISTKKFTEFCKAMKIADKDILNVIVEYLGLKVELVYRKDNSGGCILSQKDVDEICRM